MNLKEIRDEAWEVARDDNDVEADRLWSKTEMNRMINRIYRDIARKTLCIRDSTTPAICLIASAPVDYTTYVEGTIDYIWANDANGWLYQKDVAPYLIDLDPSILRIDEVKWTSRAWKLVKVSVQKWQTNSYWELVSGQPTEYATDLTEGKIALNFRDTESDTLRLVVRRLPLVALSGDKDIPEFKAQYHDAFLNGVLDLMYRKQDVETFDLAKAEQHKELYLDDLDEVKRAEIGIENKLNPNNSLSAFR